MKERVTDELFVDVSHNRVGVIFQGESHDSAIWMTFSELDRLFDTAHRNKRSNENGNISAHKKLQTGMCYILHGNGDLGCNRELRKYIGTLVSVVQKNKSGTYQVRTDDGKLISVPKRNLLP